MTETTAAITVAIRCVNDSVSQFRECLDAVLAQRQPTADVVVVDSSDHEEFAELCVGVERVKYLRIPGKNLSNGRNVAIAQSVHDRIMFTDPDCVPQPGWLTALNRELEAGAAVVGGRIVPRWLATPPWIVRNSSLARNQLALRDTGGGTAETDRVFGASMGFSKLAVGENAWFREDLGRVDGVLLSGEDTEFCERAIRGGGRVVFVSDAVVEHQIPKRRLRYSWTFKRTFFTGLRIGVPTGDSCPIRG
ncbi:MAG: glycosyltransferase [bacterium]|nr:glycosyltransferase [bacterium]